MSKTVNAVRVVEIRRANGVKQIINLANITTIDLHADEKTVEVFFVGSDMAVAFTGDEAVPVYNELRARLDHV